MIPRLRRTRRSTVLYWPHVHLFLFRQGLFFGTHLRYRGRDGLWRHHRLTMFEPSRHQKGRGTFTCEWCSWLTTHADRSQAPFRVGLKTFVRLKIGLGGSSSPAEPREVAGT